MGVDTRVSLPPNVMINHVAEVIGKLLGAPSKLTVLGGSPYGNCNRDPLGHEPHGTCDGHPSYGVDVAHTTTESATAVVECANIRVAIPGDEPRRFFYHFELPGGRRGITLHSATARNIALAHAIVDFFGGRVDDNDSDRTCVDYEVPDKSDDENCPNDGEPWHSLQRRIHALQPVAPLHRRFEANVAYRD
jgi:hypothetical protein